MPPVSISLMFILFPFIPLPTHITHTATTTVSEPTLSLSTTPWPFPLFPPFSCRPSSVDCRARAMPDQMFLAQYKCFSDRCCTEPRLRDTEPMLLVSFDSFYHFCTPVSNPATVLGTEAEGWKAVCLCHNVYSPVPLCQRTPGRPPSLHTYRYLAPTL